MEEVTRPLSVEPMLRWVSGRSRVAVIASRRLHRARCDFYGPLAAGRTLSSARSVGQLLAGGLRKDAAARAAWRGQPRTVAARRRRPRVGSSLEMDEVLRSVGDAHADRRRGDVPATSTHTGRRRGRPHSIEADDSRPRLRGDRLPASRHEHHGPRPGAAPACRGGRTSRPTSTQRARAHGVAPLRLSSGLVVPLITGARCRLCRGVDEARRDFDHAAGAVTARQVAAQALANAALHAALEEAAHA